MTRRGKHAPSRQAVSREEKSVTVASRHRRAVYYTARVRACIIVLVAAAAVALT